MRLLLITVFITCASLAQATPLLNGDRIVCHDETRGDTYFIKVVDVNTESAYIKIFGSEPRFYPSNRVFFDQKEGSILFVMFGKNDPLLFEALKIPDIIEFGGNVAGIYIDPEQSWGVKCIIDNI